MKKLSVWSPMKVISLGYCLIILLGAGLLCLPFATTAGEHTSVLDALFTATSATCVTGLVRYDTFTHWTVFGQLVILLLIQIGGIGFITLATYFVSLTKRKIGLSERVLMRESVSAPQLGGIVRMTRFILTGTLIVEGIGALLLTVYYCPRVGLFEGLYFSVFHSISAFCNAGFDLMGKFEPFSSLTLGSGNWYLNVVIMLLIIIGGLGFFVWSDLVKCRFRFRQLRLHSKLVLCTSGALILLGTLGILALEQTGRAYEHMPVGEQILQSLFQSVTARTAGFNTANLPVLRPATQLLIVCLMIVGGSPGSTAGGMKTTTLAISVLSVFSTFRRKKSIECFGRRVEDEVVRTTTCVMLMYVLLSLMGGIVIAAVENVPIMAAMFETVSAIGTVGLTLGITTQVGILSQAILIFLMIFGRVGSITILLALASNHSNPPSRMPVEKVQIG